MGARGLMLVGEPGTAKSMLSELLAVGVSGTSTLTIQGSAGTTEDHLRYAWNYALLLSQGITPKALVPSPMYRGMAEGKVVRFEEITRCAQEVQDVMISLLSEKLIQVPELEGHPESTLMARPGFTVIATANLRDRGVHEMSSALKRRFAFETVPAIADRRQELSLIQRQLEALLAEAGTQAQVPDAVLDVLVTVFQDLRTGQSAEGIAIDKPSTVMSTAEAVSVAFNSAMEARYFADGKADAATVARNLVGAVLQDDPNNRGVMARYLDTVVRPRAAKNRHWAEVLNARALLSG